MTGGFRPRTSPLARASILLAVLLALIGIPAERAAACSATDIECVVEDVEKAVGGTGQAVEDTVDQIDDELSETVGEIEETVSETVREVEETLPRAVGVPQDTQPDATAGDPPSGSAPDGASQPDEVRAARERGPTTPSEPPVTAARPDEPILRPSELSVSLSAPVREAASPLDQSGVGPENEFAEVIRRFAFPLLLSALVALFLLLQGRVDRRDPKLSLAPLEEETLLFR
jgi:hypothetical protein